jgi:hypothetical protein
MKTLVVSPDTIGRPQLREHCAGIYLDDLPLARPYGCICSCGWRSANVTEEEAEGSKNAHAARYEHPPKPL